VVFIEEGHYDIAKVIAIDPISDFPIKIIWLTGEDRGDEDGCKENQLRPAVDADYVVDIDGVKVTIETSSSYAQRTKMFKFVDDPFGGLWLTDEQAEFMSKHLAGGVPIKPRKAT